MKRHDAGELERFLAALDHALAEPVSIVVIGGSALALGYQVSTVTNDIDTFESHLDPVLHVVHHVRRATGLDVPIASSTVAQLPEGFEARMKRVLPQFEKLVLWVPDPHDLAASKLLRGNDHDRQQLAELHRTINLDREMLIARFEQLLSDYTGDTTEPRWSLFHFVSEIWGELAAFDLDPRNPRA